MNIANINQNVVQKLINYLQFSDLGESQFQYYFFYRFSLDMAHSFDLALYYLLIISIYFMSFPTKLIIYHTNLAKKQFSTMD